MIEKRTVKDYANAKAAYESSKLEYDLLLKGFNEVNAGLISAVAAKKAELDALAGNLRVQGANEYEETGAKKLTGGLGIRVSKTVDYDTDIATKWAKEKGMFIALDKKAFDKSAGSLGLDFVKVGEKITVTIPKEVTIDE